MMVSPQLKQEASMSEQAVTYEQISRLGPGLQLKTAREARHVSVEEVATRLHLTKSVIHDIENDNYDPRLAFTFIRGYLRSYARLVHVSPEAILKSFDQLGLKERRAENMLPKLPVTTWRAQESYVRWAGYAVAAIVSIIVIVLSAWWLMQPPGMEPVSQDLVKLLNNTAESRAVPPVNAEPTLNPGETTGGLSPLEAASQSSPSQNVGGDKSAPSLLIPSSTTPTLSSPVVTDQKAKKLTDGGAQ